MYILYRAAYDRLRSSLLVSGMNFVILACRPLLSAVLVAISNSFCDTRVSIFALVYYTFSLASMILYNMKIKYAAME